ncbi:MAG TPA: hypothetical protein VF112_06225 [Candidatus Dormibacteraeota bacterium]
MEGTATRRRVGFVVGGIRVVVTRTAGEQPGGAGYAAELARGGDVARARLLRFGNACCLEVAAAPAWLHAHCALPATGQAASVTDGETVWLEVPPLVRAEVVLPWLEQHRHELRLAARSA